MSYAYWPVYNTIVNQRLNLSSNVLSLVPGNSVLLPDVSGGGIIMPLSTLTVLEEAHIGNIMMLSSGIVACSEVDLFNSAGPTVQLLAGANTLSIVSGGNAGTVYDTVINPPTLLDHLAVANVLQAGSIAAPSAAINSLSAVAISASSIVVNNVTFPNGVLSTIGSNLTWNGDAIVTSSTNTSISDWAQYSANHDVNGNGKTFGGIGHFGQTGNATMGFVDYSVFGNTYSMTNVLGEFWVGQKIDYVNSRPDARFYVSKFQVGGNGGQNDVVCYPDFYVYPTDVYFGSVVQPCRSFNVISLGGINLDSAYGLSLNGGGGISVNGLLGVSVLGGGGVSVLGGIGVTVTAGAGVAITGGGGVAVTGGLGVAVTGGIGVAVTAGAGVNIAGGGGVAIEGGGGIALIGGTIEISPDALAHGGDVNINAGGHLNVKGTGGVYANAIAAGDLGYLNIGAAATNGVTLSNVTRIDGNNSVITGVAAPVAAADAATKGYVDNVPIMQQVSIEFNTTLSSAVNCIYNFWPQQPSLNLTLPTASTVGTWITIANSSPLYTLQFNVTSPAATVSIAPNSSVRVVCGLDNDVLPSWFVC